MFPNGMIPTRSMYIFPNGMIWKEGPLAVFWWVSRARAERRRGRRATGPPARGRSRWRGAPRCETPGGPLEGRRERVGFLDVGRRRSRRTPLACARPSRSTQAVVNSDSLLYPVVSTRDPLRQLLGCLSVRCAKIYASSRQCSYVLGLKLRQND